MAKVLCTYVVVNSESVMQEMEHPRIWYVNVEKTSLQGGLFALCSFLRRGSRGKGAGLCSLGTEGRFSGEWHTAVSGKVQTGEKEQLLHQEGGQALEQAF